MSHVVSFHGAQPVAARLQPVANRPVQPARSFPIVRDEVHFGNSQGPQQPKKPGFFKGALIAAAMMLGVSAMMGGGGRTGNVSVPQQFQGPSISAPATAPGDTLPEASAPPPVTVQAPRYQNGSLLANVDEALKLAEEGKIREVRRVEDPSRTIKPFYELTLTDGVVVVLEEPETQAEEQRLNLGLREHNIHPKRVGPEGSVLGGLLFSLLPIALLIGAMVWLQRRAAGGAGNLLASAEKSAFEVSPAVDTRFNDVKGYPEVIEELQEVVTLTRNFQKNRQKSPPPRGVLLTGPPGTGKTLMARAIAGESGLPFISLSGSKFVEMFVGRGAARVRALFEMAKQLEQQHGGCIIFIDEIDAIGKKRGAGLEGMGGNDEREGTLNELLVQMDGFDKGRNIVVIAATNRADVLDPGLTRAGRFDRKIQVDKPRDPADRKEILELYAHKLNLADDVDLMAIARTAKGFVGADLANLAKEANIIASRKGHDQVTQGDFVDAISRVRLGIARPKKGTPKQKELVGHHEVVGHGLLALANRINLFIVSMIPRGDSLGHVVVDPDDELGEGVHTREDLLRNILYTIGGRAAEKAEYGEDGVTTGAASDLQQFENLFRYLMSNALLTNERKDYMSENTPITEADRKIMNRLYQEALQTGVEVIQQLPVEKRRALVEESLKRGDLIGEQAHQFYREILGPDFDWNKLYALADRFVADPLGTHRTQDEQAA